MLNITFLEDFISINYQWHWITIQCIFQRAHLHRAVSQATILLAPSFLERKERSKGGGREGGGREGGRGRGRGEEKKNKARGRKGGRKGGRDEGREKEKEGGKEGQGEKGGKKLLWPSLQ